MSYKADGGGGGYPRTLPSAGKEIRVNHEVLRDVHRQLRADFDGVQADIRSVFAHLRVQTDSRGEILSVDAELTDEVLLTGAQLGRYPAAEGMTDVDGLAGSCRNAHDRIGEVYRQFLTAYGQMIAALRRSADNHAEAEQQSAETMKRVYPDSSSPSPGSQFYA